jgi:adenylate kinase
MKHLLIMGPPGAGKGTQAVALATDHGVPAISTGDLFRSHVREGTPLGTVAREYLDRGEYVPDTITNDMVAERLGRPDCATGFLLDGYPRTLDQVAALDAILAASDRALDTVVALVVDPEELVRRLVRRASLQHRSDDTEDVIRRRQAVYAEETAPLLAEYAARGVLVTVDGSGTVDEVTARVRQSLGIGV